MGTFRDFEFLVLLAIACITTACTPPAFPLLKPSEGWIQLAKPPIEVKEILSIASDSFKSRYFDRDSTATWFVKPNGTYLIYIRDNYSNDFFANEGLFGCGDVTFTFEKIEGKWIEKGGGLGTICVD